MANSNTRTVAWQQLFGWIEGLQADRDNVIAIEPEVVPIIFVPGLLGSRLRQTSTGDTVWDPDATRFMLGRYAVRSVSGYHDKLLQRKHMLVGESGAYDEAFLSVINDDQAHNEEHFGDIPMAAERGWGGVSWSSYGAILTKLVQPGREIIEPVRQCTEWPVHAFGYDWTQPLRTSARDLASYVQATVRHYKGRARVCDHVILVTHSMGGLVGRGAAKLIGTQSVLGLIHCGQPVTGAASAYWRMKAGVERPADGRITLQDWFANPGQMIKEKTVGTITGHVSAWTMGPNGEALTSIIANMPGPLHLLPTRDYRDAQGRTDWLRYPAVSGGETTLPTGDPYQEIYRQQTKFYKLVEEEWLLPSQAQVEADEQANELLGASGGPSAAWAGYLSLLGQAEDYHADLGPVPHHPYTVQMFGWGQTTADGAGYTRQPDGSRWETFKRLTKGITPRGEIKEQIKGVLDEEFMGMELVKELAAGGWSGIVFDPTGFSFLQRIGRRIGKTALSEVPAVALLGGYRMHVGLDDNPVDFRRLWRTAQVDGEPGPVYLMELKLPASRLGDGTVARTSAGALDAWREVRVTGADEVWTQSGHEALYSTETVKEATLRAVEALCLRKVASGARAVRNRPPPVRERPAPPAPRQEPVRRDPPRRQPTPRPPARPAPECAPPRPPPVDDRNPIEKGWDWLKEQFGTPDSGGSGGGGGAGGSYGPPCSPPFGGYGNGDFGGGGANGGW